MEKLIFILLFASINVFAGCESEVQNYILKAQEQGHKEIKLVKENSVILLPGMKGNFIESPFYNRWKSTVEVYFLAEAEDYSALIIDANKCKALEKQELVAGTR